MPNICSTCKNPFEISIEEAALREKISQTLETGPVPPPTGCPDCRMQRLMARRNERTLYTRQCSKTGKQIISVYPQDAPFPVYERTVWWSDDWDPLQYGQDFDFHRPFFEQFAELQNKVPRSALNGQNSENCDYCNYVFDSRNSYLSHNNYKCDGMLYTYWTLECKDCMDVSYCFQCERCFSCVDCNHSYNCRYCVLAHNCSDSFFLYDCRGCSNCFGCVGLRQKSYCYFNEQLSKEQYTKRLAEFDLQNPADLKKIEERVAELKLAHPHLYSIQEKTEDCTGDYVFESKDCKNCFQIYRSQDCINVTEAETKDALDCHHPGWSQGTYASNSPVRQQNSAFVHQCWSGNDIFYSDNCQSCEHLFGCIGLKHKKFCILNKQYSEKEYRELLPRIVEHMKRTGQWGQFFPIEISPFAYNETNANVYFPLTEAEIEQRGWRVMRRPPYTLGKETITKIPARIQDVPESITQEVLACTKCQRNYRIIPQELSFLKEIQTPLPSLCPECRYLQRLATRNPQKLWKRKCMSCQKPIETTYAPKRPEKIYCEACYLKKIY